MTRRLPQPVGASLLFFAVGLCASGGCGDSQPVRRVVQGESDMIEVPQHVLEASRDKLQTVALEPTILYLNFNGATITMGYKSDSTSNTSFIGGGNVPAFPGDQSMRDQVTSLVKQLFADFNIQIVTTRPTSGNYDMALIGGSPSSIGLGYSSNVTGVAPMDCDNEMPRDIAFVFADNIKALVPSSMFPQEVAETTAHEAGHTYGLPHSNNSCDLMSYGSCSQMKTFRDEEMGMQSDSQGSCGMYSMNSHQILLDTLGAGVSEPPPPPPDSQPPQVQIDTPVDGQTVGADLTVKATISDNDSVTEASLLVDGTTAGTSNAPPYQFSITLDAGQHQLEVRARDAAGNQGSDAVTVTVEPPPPPPDTQPPPPGTGDPQDPSPSPEPTAPGPGNPETEPAPEPLPGQFGAPCKGPEDCDSKLCAEDSAFAGTYCTEQCDPGSNSCPEGNECLSAGGSIYVCAASEDTLHAAPDDAMLLGSCSTAGTTGGAKGAAQLPALSLLLLLLAFVVRVIGRAS